MKIETKFNIGDIVWYMEDNQATSDRVVSIYAEQRQDGKDEWNRPLGGDVRVAYTVHDCDGEHTQVRESKVFPTKEELLKSL